MPSNMAARLGSASTWTNNERVAIESWYDHHIIRSRTTENVFSSCQSIKRVSVVLGNATNPEEASNSFQQWLAEINRRGEIEVSHRYDGVRLFRLDSYWHPEQGCAVTVTERPWAYAQDIAVYQMRFLPDPLTDKRSGCNDTDGDETLARDGRVVNDPTMENTQNELLVEHLHNPKDPEAIARGFRCLFHIVLNAGIRFWKVRHLGHELACHALADLLSENQDVVHLEFDATVTGSSELDLCARILRTTCSIKTVYFPILGSYTPDQIQSFFQSLGSKSSVETLDLSSSCVKLMLDDYVTYSRDWMMPDLDCMLNHKNGISFEPLINAMVTPNNEFSLKKLDLSGLTLSSGSVVALANALPGLGLEALLLRGAFLGADSAEALSAIAKALGKDRTLNKLDISINAIKDQVVVEALCTSLKENTSLKTLLLEFCGMGVELVEIFAKSIPGMKGLRYLNMNGNDFTRTPQREVVDDEGRSVGMFPVGPAVVVDALEQNYNLLSVKVGDINEFHEGLDPRVPRPIEPDDSSYPCLDKLTSSKLTNYRKRNKNYARSKMKEAVVRLATMLLAKMNEESASRQN